MYSHLNHSLLSHPLTSPSIPHSDRLARGVMVFPRNPSTDDDTREEASPDDFAEETSAKMDQVVATPTATYVLKTELRKDSERGVEFYDVMRRSDRFAFRMEFDKCDADGATISKRFELEATMRSIFHLLPNALPVHHLHICNDLGAHSPWRFLVFPEEYISVAQYLSEAEKGERTPQLALQLAIQSFLGIQMLHKVDIVHGDIRPENMFIGANRQSRMVKIANFDHSISYSKEIPKCSDIGNLVYASRGRMRNYEGSKKDDVESWIYCMAEFFHVDLLPWHPDSKANQIPACGQPGHEMDMLKLKRAFCKLRMWKAAKEILPCEFDKIIAVMMSTTGRGDVSYDKIWSLLNSANLYVECPALGFGPWIKINQGASTSFSSFVCTPIPDAVEDYVGRDL